MADRGINEFERRVAPKARDRDDSTATMPERLRSAMSSPIEHRHASGSRGAGSHVTV
jgi:hypothetical protein